MRHGIVAQKLVNAFWPAELSTVIQTKDVQTLIDKAELNHEQAEKVIVTLSSAEILFALEVVELSDKPQIELKDGPIQGFLGPFHGAEMHCHSCRFCCWKAKTPCSSIGPEDNLDNRFIFETVVGSIRIEPRKIDN